MKTVVWFSAMAIRLHKTSGLGRQGHWPVLLLLIVATLVPTVCVLWFMTEAMRNERLAVRQRVTDAYRGHLVTIRRRLDALWRSKQAALASVDAEASPAMVFAELVRSGVADSVIVYDASGQVAYPADWGLETGDLASESPQWRRAWTLEYRDQDCLAAADLYGSLAGEARDSDTAAGALRARARCLVKAGRQQPALGILIGDLADPQYRGATDEHGNMIVPDAQLRALELMTEPGADEYRRILRALVDRLEDYGDPCLSASQRCFLMQQLPPVAPGCPESPMLQAEILAADYLDYRRSNPPPADRRRLRRSGFGDVWELASPDESAHVVALFREERIFKEMQSLIESELAISDVTVKLVAADALPTGPAALLRGPAGEYLPDWQLGLWLDDGDPFSAAADRRISGYLYSGILVVLAMVALAGLVARYVGRQIRVTRLRNDLIATVSHELKTPLSSIRALIDTLLEGRYHDEQQHREYLQLAAKENERLSRLIDNFLAFSRMERNKRTFEFSEVEVEEIVAAAVDAVREKFDAAGARLEVDVAVELPKINGDADALTTMLVDLLDNAHKYTGDDKHVVVRAYADGGKIRLEVQDNGVGLSRRAAKKVFGRFFQVDQSLSRRTGGCGLGLSIVRFIVTAHGGSVGVSSRAGRGSTFAVTLPATEIMAAGGQQKRR